MPADGLLVCYGGMMPFALAAARHLREREQLHLGLIIVSQLSPTPVAHLEAILGDAPGFPIVTIEEAPAEGGWGAEIIATIAQLRDARGLGTASYRRVGAKTAPIPSARTLEEAMLPQAGDIVAAVLECF